jgi:predicted MFS family arabinose efflux permease
MQASIDTLLLVIGIAGAIGGAVNALLSDNGFLLPKSETTSAGETILRPGFLGNVLTGAVAAVISWGLYGPLSAYVVLGTAQALSSNSPPDAVGLSLSALVGAVLVGVGGARWLSGQVDKNLLRAAVAEAASKDSHRHAAAGIATASPAKTLSIAKTLVD